jgi:FtsP/CotA-like multicopper oxidase with cupredoxin domain
LAGHRLTVTHTDGFAVAPTDVDALLIGMGERYDVVITAADGVFPLVAAAEGKTTSARALLVSGSGAPPAADYAPPELQGRIGTVATFAASPGAALPFGARRCGAAGGVGRVHDELRLDDQRIAVR